MTQIHRSRKSAHPLIDTVWHSRNVTDGIYSATPDGSWDLIVMVQADGSRAMMLTGQATKPSDVPYTAGTQSIVISFAPGAYMPAYPAKKLVDSFEILPNADADHFVLSGHTFAFPTFDNAEELVEQLIAAKLLYADSIVHGAYRTSKRSAQRHFAENTGLTQKSFTKIERAQEAVRQLKAGKKPSDVAADVGYTDQSHLARDLRTIMGVKPSDVDGIHKL